jgi:glycosyltransferase involved in cell wall biosynthesis
MSKVLVLASWPRSLINFRGPLLRAMVAAGHEVVAAAPDVMEGIPDRLAALGVRFVPVDLERAGTDPRRDVATFRQLVRVLAKERPEVMLSYTIKPVIYGSIAGKVAGVKRIYSAITGLGHLFIDPSRKVAVARAVACQMYKAALKTNHRVFFQNPDDRGEFVRRGLVPEEKTVIVNGSGVDLASYPRVPPVTDPPTFLYMGRYLVEKGLRELIEAVRVVKAQAPDARVVLVGRADDNPSSIRPAELASWIAEGLVEDKGWVEDVRPYLRDCSVYVLPSYREGTPRSVLEAMASGRPVITTDAPGCRETVKHGVTGLLVPVRTSAPLAEAMLSFVRDRQQIVRMGDASWQYVAEKYDVNAVNRHMLRTMGLLPDGSP